jgi:hypothetical protein
MHLMKKVTNENQDSATADICIKNATNLLHYAEAKQTRHHLLLKTFNSSVAQTVFCF